VHRLAVVDRGSCLCRQHVWQVLVQCCLTASLALLSACRTSPSKVSKEAEQPARSMSAAHVMRVLSVLCVW
jgi:starvation-inducible outer membrane lipoprotein